jgi:hypothetical protein
MIHESWLECGVLAWVMNVMVEHFGGQPYNLLGGRSVPLELFKSYYLYVLLFVLMDGPKI